MDTDDHGKNTRTAAQNNRVGGEPREVLQSNPLALLHFLPCDWELHAALQNLRQAWFEALLNPASVQPYEACFFPWIARGFSGTIKAPTERLMSNCPVSIPILHLLQIRVGFTRACVIKRINQWGKSWDCPTLQFLEFLHRSLSAQTVGKQEAITRRTYA